MAGRGNGKGNDTDHHLKGKNLTDCEHRQKKMTEYTHPGVHGAGRGRGSPSDSTSHRTDSYKGNQQHGAWSQNHHHGGAAKSHTDLRAGWQRDDGSNYQKSKKHRPQSETWREVKGMFILRMAETVNCC